MKSFFCLCLMMTLCLSGCIDSGNRNESSSKDFTQVEGDPERGIGLFNRHCAACHGSDAKGNEAINAPSIIGKTATHIEWAINNIAYMSSLGSLLEAQDIVDIASHLQTLDNTNQSNRALTSSLLELSGTTPVENIIVKVKDAKGQTCVTRSNQQRIFSFHECNLVYPVQLAAQVDGISLLGARSTPRKEPLALNYFTDVLIRNTSRDATQDERIEQAESLLEDFASYFNQSPVIDASFVLDGVIESSPNQFALSDFIRHVNSAYRRSHCDNRNNPHGVIVDSDTDYDCHSDTEIK